MSVVQLTVMFVVELTVMSVVELTVMSVVEFTAISVKETGCKILANQQQFPKIKFFVPNSAVGRAHILS